MAHLYPKNIPRPPTAPKQQPLTSRGKCIVSHAYYRKKGVFWCKTLKNNSFLHFLAELSIAKILVLAPVFT